jgi:hypothetical protein
MGDGQAPTNAGHPNGEAELPLLLQRGMVIRFQILASLVLVMLIGCLVSETFREALDPVPFPLFAAVGFPYVLLTGWLAFRRQAALHRLRHESAAG